MFKHQLLLIYRNILRDKATFFINLIGLSTGLASSLLIYLWVNDELSVDKFHEKDSQLYQVRSNYQNTRGTETNFETAGILAEALAEEMPEVEFATVATPVYWFGKFNLLIDKGENFKAVGRYAGEDYFNVFSYNLLQGDEEEVLARLNNIVISEELALNLFNTLENIIGKTILLQQEREFVISGVFEKTPANSTEQFDFVLPFKNLQEKYPRFAMWDQRGPSTYLILSEGTDIGLFNEKLNRFHQNKTKETNITLFATRYSDDYLYGQYENGVQAGGRIDYLRLFSVIAGFILLIACINFMNLSTARATGRIKEIGIKKAIGAERKTLVFQFIGESLLLSFAALLVAIFLVVLLIPMFNEVTAKTIGLSLHLNLLWVLIGITIFTGLLAGSYPAFYLSGFNPTSVLKGKLNASVGELWVRKGLVVFQFSLSIILIGAVLVVFKQAEYMQTKNLGYDKENVMIFDLEGRGKDNPEPFLQELKRLPGVVNASTISSRLTGSYGATSGLHWEGKNPEDIISFEAIQVNYDLIETLGIDVVSGRTYSREYRADSNKIIFNEAAIAAMGITDPVGKSLNFWGNEVEILGVVKDFHIESLHEKVKPLLLILRPEQTQFVMVKIKAGEEKAALGQFQDFYREYNSCLVPDFKFLDENYQTLYEAEQRVATLSRYFAGLAILISCLGLFGLVSFTTQRRRKEIGIRKALGSGNFSIVWLLTSDFTKLVISAIIIATPLCYFVARNWLDSFAYRIELEWWYFVTAGGVALVVAWFTVGMKAIRAAQINPVKALKWE